MPLINNILLFMRHQQGDFNLLALDVFAYQFEHCLPYQRYCKQLEITPDNCNHWHDIPAVPTDVFREFDLCTFDPPEAKYIFETSGTTHQEKGKHFYRDLSLYDEAIRLSFLRGINLQDKSSLTFRILTPSFNEIKTSSLFYMLQQTVEWYGNDHSRFYMKHNELDYTSLEKDLLDDMAANRPIALIGTAFSFVNFFDHFPEKTWTLPQGSVLMETGGLKGRTRHITREALYELFFSRLHLSSNQCFSEYGMTELSSQCYSLPNSHTFYAPHWMPTRIIDPETGLDVQTGETGIVQFFDLANLESISAIMTADLAIKKDNGFELIGRAPLAEQRGCSLPFE